MKFDSPIVFPRDEGSHPEALDEWWYMNCQLYAQKENRSFAIIACFFPDRLLTMVVDVSNRRMAHNNVQKFQKFTSSKNLLDLSFGKSWWKQTDNDPTNYKIHLDVGKLFADLSLEPVKQPMLIDGTGVIREGLLGRSYYYAYPRLQTNGTICVDGQNFEVTGIGWIDRQWGEWEWGGLGSWRWFSIQLDSGVEMLVIQITHPLSEAIVSQNLTLSERDGKTRVYRSFTVSEIGKWKSPGTGRSYEIGWQIAAPGHFKLRVSPVLADQECMKGLWEGACEVEGTFEGTAVRGRAYVEQSHGRVNGKKRKILFFFIGIANHILRRTFSANVNLPYRLKVLLEPE